MTSKEPTRNQDGEIVRGQDGTLPALGRPSWFEVRERQRTRRAVVEEEQLRALVKAYRARNATALHDQHAAEIIRRGERIVAELQATDNPLIRQGLEESWHNWMNDIRRIISE